MFSAAAPTANIVKDDATPELAKSLQVVNLN
jgi:hypothetical protein